MSDLDAKQVLNETVPEEMAGLRLDIALARLFPDFSRSRLQKWIKQGLVTVDDQIVRPKDIIYGGEFIELSAQQEQQQQWQPQAISLDIVYEDEHLLVINKAAGLVVHPGAGNPQNTLANALLHHADQLQNIPRAGIVHRIDKDTTGLLVVAKTLQAHKALIEQLQDRAFTRQYRALVKGSIISGGTVDANIGRHPVHRTKMAVRINAKEAVTHYRVAQRFHSHTEVVCKLETGRTHQIRVHMEHVGHPLVGDPLYGGRLQLPSQCSDEFADILRQFKRQALHAELLGLQHPQTHDYMEWSATLPQDMQNLLDQAKLNEQTNNK